jgi:hypothetical protein
MVMYVQLVFGMAEICAFIILIILDNSNSLGKKIIVMSGNAIYSTREQLFEIFFIV